MSNASVQLALSLFGPDVVRKDPVSVDKRVDVSKQVVKPVWGLMKADFKVLDFRALGGIFRGLHNLRVPNAMADSMNPDELVAKYLGAALLKVGNGHKGRDYEFLDLVREMDRMAYPMLAPMVQRTKGRNFGADQGMQLTRLGRLDDTLKARFMDSFGANYQVSNRENRRDFHYHDPNCDGRDAGLYVDRIFDKLKARQVNTKL